MRLETMVKTRDGFKIAEADLQIRGPGHYFGGLQSGSNELRMANPLTQMELLEKARAEAIALTKKDGTLKTYPQIKATIQKRYPQYLAMVAAG